MIRRTLSTGLMWLCWAVDSIPWWEEGRWYRHGHRGCLWGISNLAVKVYGDEK